ncbi:hypothetical protein ACOME3_009916 [Neoechinorhynchus agilis]
MSDSIAIRYKGHFECGDGNRVNLKSLCDGIVDCSTGTDETVLCGRCIDNKYYCAENNVIRCSLSCAVIGYVPCNGIEDRAACQRLYTTGNFSTLTSSLTSALTSPLLHVGLAVFIGLIVGLSFLINRNRRKKREQRNETKRDHLQNIYVRPEYEGSHHHHHLPMEPVYTQLAFEEAPHATKSVHSLPPSDCYSSRTEERKKTNQLQFGA